MIKYDIDHIQKLLPHRFPFLLVDRILEIEEGKFLRALKNVTANEAHFSGHFPRFPVMPGVLILEALAQAGGLLANLSLPQNESGEKIHFLAGIDGARFKEMVRPGDQLILEVTVLNVKATLFKIKGVAKVDGKVVCEAEFLSMSKNISKERAS